MPVIISLAKPVKNADTGRTNQELCKVRAKTIIGWRECVGLPGLGVGAVKAKIDTGARTSALHAFNVRRFKKGDEAWVRFTVHPIKRKRKPQVVCEAKFVDIRYVTSSNGVRERRIFITTQVQLGPYKFPIELSLTNRDEMGYRMLLGRQALKRRFIVDSGISYTFGKKEGQVS